VSVRSIATGVLITTCVSDAGVSAVVGIQETANNKINKRQTTLQELTA
jgi:hypothetical protein